MKQRLSEKVQVSLTPSELLQIESMAAAEERSVSNTLRQLIKAGMTAAGSEQRATA
jgi:hypothetical protein